MPSAPPLRPSLIPLRYGYMPIPPESIAEFKALWNKKYGQDLSDIEVTTYAEDLVAFVRFVVKGHVAPPKLSDIL